MRYPCCKHCNFCKQVHTWPCENCEAENPYLKIMNDINANSD